MVAHLTSEANVLLEFCSEGARIGVLRSFVSYKSSRHLPGSILHRSTSFGLFWTEKCSKMRKVKKEMRCKEDRH